MRIIPSRTFAQTVLKDSNRFVLASLAFVSLSSTFTFRADAQVTPKVIYGMDNRKELYQVTNPKLVTAAKSTAAMVDRSEISFSGGMANLGGETIGPKYQLCSNERFFRQKDSARCSSFLIAPDLMATAGHCMENQLDCDLTAVVFDYAYTSPGSNPQRVPGRQVYNCKRLIKSVYTPQEDFAVFRIERKVTDRQPLKIRQSGSPTVGSPLVMIGNPIGIPTKVAAGAKIRTRPGQGFFEASTDSYAGNSGSAVLNANNLEVEGILVRGEEDFVAAGNCFRSKVCTESGCLGEDVTLSRFIRPFGSRR